MAPKSSENMWPWMRPGRTSTRPMAENRSVRSRPQFLHLQDAVTGKHVYDSEDNDAKAGNVAEVAEEPFDGVAFGGERSEFGSQSGEEQDGEPEHERERTAQDLVKADQSDA